MASVAAVYDGTNFILEENMKVSAGQRVIITVMDEFVYINKEKCAISIGAYYIIPENISDFRTSKIPATLPLDVVEIINSRKSE